MAKTILIVNDSIELLELMKMVLEEEGYDVKLNSTRMKDLNGVKEVEPDLLIIDQLIGSTDVNGWELIQKMKLDRKTAAIPIILCTSAINLVKELNDQLNSKNVGVVLKPFDIEDLLNAVTAALGDQ